MFCQCNFSYSEGIYVINPDIWCDVGSIFLPNYSSDFLGGSGKVTSVGDN